MSSGRILIIDDDPSVGRLLQRMFGNHRIELVQKPAEALKLLQAGERFDCILCDVCMPKLNGVEVMRAISEIDPLQADRLIFLTGYPPAAETVSRATRRPIVAKPFQTVKLRQMVEARVSSSTRATDEWDEPTLVERAPTNG